MKNHLHRFGVFEKFDLLSLDSSKVSAHDYLICSNLLESREHHKFRCFNIFTLLIMSLWIVFATGIEAI